MNFSSANLTTASKNWNLTNPLYGTIPFVFQSALDIEFVVIKVRSAIFKGSYLPIILASLQNSVKALADTAQTPSNGLKDEKYLYIYLIFL